MPLNPINQQNFLFQKKKKHHAPIFNFGIGFESISHKKKPQMIKKFGLWASAISIIILQSCSVNTETTYYKDTATSMQSNVLIDNSMFAMLNMMGNSSDASKAITGENLDELSTDWQSIYDIQKNEKIVLNDKDAQALKKMYIKLNKDKGEISGISLKYDKLLPAEIAAIFASKKELRRIPLQDIAKWDGNRLEIDTEKFNSTEFLKDLQIDDTEKPETKSDSVEAYGKQMASAAIGMMKMMKLNYSNTLKFQKNIKSIEGKHDFVEQLDKNTIKINVKTADLWDEGKHLKNKDKKIIITTE